MMVDRIGIFSDLVALMPSQPFMNLWRFQQPTNRSGLDE